MPHQLTNFDQNLTIHGEREFSDPGSRIDLKNLLSKKIEDENEDETSQ